MCIDRFIEFWYFSNEKMKLGYSSALPAAAPCFAGRALSSTAGQCWAYRRGHAEEKKQFLDSVAIYLAICSKILKLPGNHKNFKHHQRAWLNTLTYLT